MRIEETKIFKYSELSDTAKEKAREWWIGHVYTSPSDWEHVYDDAKHIAKLFGLEISDISYSGFWSQGDGACFEGSYRYVKDSVKNVKAYAPQDTELHEIVSALAKAQKKHFYKLKASCKHRGHYNHSGCMQVDVYHTDDEYRDIGDTEKDVRDLLRSFADWIYEQLEKDYEYQTSDENAEECILANEYEFLEDGSRA